MNIIVLVKQVPDTHNVGSDAMTEEGTVNRAALPAIFNPDDMNALEMALRLKEKYGGKVTLITMGLPKAEEILRDGVMRGADNGILLTDRALGGADTLATSYSLSQAIKKVGTYDIILCGRQAIDGDTAQVGPQVAEKLGLPQVTYVEEIIGLSGSEGSEGSEVASLVLRRKIDGGVETVECPLPCLLTVNGSAAKCRSRNVKRVMQYKKTEFQRWGATDIDADPLLIGKTGSPTNVKAVKNIVFKAKEARTLSASDADISELVKELVENNTI